MDTPKPITKDGVEFVIGMTLYDDEFGVKYNTTDSRIVLEYFDSEHVWCIYKKDDWYPWELDRFYATRKNWIINHIEEIKSEINYLQVQLHKYEKELETS